MKFLSTKDKKWLATARESYVCGHNVLCFPPNNYKLPQGCFNTVVLKYYLGLPGKFFFETLPRSFVYAVGLRLTLNHTQNIVAPLIVDISVPKPLSFIEGVSSVEG